MTKDLEEFVQTRHGVEAFVEPQTAIYSTTVLLIAHDGEYLRRPVKDRRHAGSFCKDFDIPLYDAAKVGYPKRMRDYEQGRGPRRVELSELPPWPGDDGATPPDGGVDGPPPPPPDGDRGGDPPSGHRPGGHLPGGDDVGDDDRPAADTDTPHDVEGPGTAPDDEPPQPPR